LKRWENWEGNGVRVGGRGEEDATWDGKMAIERQREGNTEWGRLGDGVRKT